jgi:hypothetical protein
VLSRYLSGDLFAKVKNIDQRGGAYMSCPYFKEGFVGVCVAFELMYIPSITRMETYCFNEHYRLCPNLGSYMPEPVKGKCSYGISGNPKGR